MSDMDLPVRDLTRSWVNTDPGSLIRCYMSVDGRVSIRDLTDYFAQHHPHVNVPDVTVSFSTLAWEEMPTEQDHAERDRHTEARRLRTEKWERETYERLKLKFEEPSDRDA